MNTPLDDTTLRRVGEALFGSACWQSELTRALGISDSRRVREWLSRGRSIPPGIWPELVELLRRRAASQAQLADALERAINSAG